MDTTIHRRYRLLVAGSVDDRLTESEHAELHLHLATCAHCRAERAAMVRDHAWLAEPPLVGPPAAWVRTGIMDAAGRRIRSVGKPPWGSLLAASLVIAVVGVAAAILQPGVGSGFLQTLQQFLANAGPAAQESPRASGEPIPTGDPGTVRQVLPNGWAVTASQVYEDLGPSLAFDGDPTTTWNSGSGEAQGWIEIDFGRPMTMTEIHLLVEQFPPGATHHQVVPLDAARIPMPAVDLEGETDSGTLLSHYWSPALEGVRYVRVTTVESPSWVAWREITIHLDDGP